MMQKHATEDAKGDAYAAVAVCPDEAVGVIVRMLLFFFNIEKVGRWGMIWFCKACERSEGEKERRRRERRHVS